MRVSGADAMMSSKPNLYKQLQSVKPAADVIESIDMGEIYIFTVFPVMPSCRTMVSGVTSQVEHCSARNKFFHKRLIKRKGHTYTMLQLQSCMLKCSVKHLLWCTILAIQSSINKFNQIHFSVFPSTLTMTNAWLFVIGTPLFVLLLPCYYLDKWSTSTSSTKIVTLLLL